MFLINKWKNSSIRSKIFISTSIIITVSFLVLYMCIYIFMPKVYYNYETNKIYENIERLKEKVSKEDNIELNEVLDEFAYENNIDLVLISDIKINDKNKMTIIYSSFRDGFKSPKLLPFIQDNINNINDFQKENGLIEFRPNKINEDKIKDNSKNGLNIVEQVYIKDLDIYATMISHVSVSPIDEASTIVTLFFPFAILAIVVIALTIGIFYSILISNPLIRINRVTKKMAELNFDNIIEIEGNDEIGQLSSSINNMNKNLKEAFTKLEDVNSKLTEEIEMERRLEKERREFTATISHELKSPITIISGQLEGMMYNIGKYKDRDKYLKESYNVVENMRELVKEILQLSERENAEFKYNFKESNISEILEEVVDELKYFIEDKKLKLQIDIEKNIVIMADEKLIKKVISNIIKNAINYSPIGEEINIKLTKIELAVENTGVVISEDELKNIFNAFYRVDKSRNRKTGGTGLGLYIVKTILDKHKYLDYNIKSKQNSVEFKIIFNK